MPVTRDDSDIGELSRDEPLLPPLTDKQFRFLSVIDEKLAEILIYRNDGTVKETVRIEFPLPGDFYIHSDNPLEPIFKSKKLILEETARRNANVYNGKVTLNYEIIGETLHITISPKYPNPTPEV